MDIEDRIRVFARNVSDHDSGFIPVHSNRQQRITAFLLRKALETLFIWVPRNLSVPQKVKTFSLTVFFSLLSPRVSLHSRAVRTVPSHCSAAYESLEHLLLHKPFCATRHGFCYNKFIVLLVHCMGIHRRRVFLCSVKTWWLSLWFQRGGCGGIERGNGKWWKRCGGVVKTRVKFSGGE